MKTSEIEFLDHEDTAIGTLILSRRSMPSNPEISVTEITIDHEFLMSSHITASERALSRIALELHPGSALRVLVGGLGLGYTAWEALQSSRVVVAQVVEFVPGVIRWMREGRVPLSAELMAEPRVDIVQGDVFEKLLQPPESSDPLFDLILIDVDHSPADHLGRSNNDVFYTPDGLRRARRHLAPDGVLGVWSYAQSSPFAAALRTVFRDVWVEPILFFNDLLEEETTDWLFFARNRAEGSSDPG